MAQANPESDQEQIKDDSGDYQSEEYSENEGEDYYYGTHPEAEEIKLQQMRDAYTDALERQAAQQ